MRPVAVATSPRVVPLSRGAYTVDNAENAGPNALAG
jgi:hypothetical protein